MDFKTITVAVLSAVAVTTGIYMLLEDRGESNSYLDQFLEHKRRYRKTYSSKEELEYRLIVFSQNMEFIDRHNQQDKPFELGENQFTDMTFTEFKNKYLFQEPLENHLKGENEGDMPAGGIDWRSQGKVTEVKNQDACGSCWAFSATGSLESAYAIFKDMTIELSEQELVDCSRDYGNFGCMGGLMTHAFDYIKSKSISTEKDYPYKAQDGVCQVDLDAQRYGLAAYKLLEPRDVTGLCDSLDKQPVSVAIEVQPDFMHYKKGIYVNDSCGALLNHGVLAVGFNTEGDIPYFIVKNSWGKDWGDQGYIKMKIGKGSGTCGIANNWDTYPQL